MGQKNLVFIATPPIVAEIVVPGYTNTEGELNVTPATKFKPSGVEGGPFSPSAKIYTITNTGDEALDFEITFVSSWLDIDPSSGSLQGSSSPLSGAAIRISLNDEVNSLAPSTSYSGIYLNFTNLTTGNGDTTREVQLTVVEAPVGILDVSPTSVVDTTGYEEGQSGGFSPSSQVYTLENIGTDSLDWEVSSNVNWIYTDVSSGTLASGDSTNVTYEIITSIVSSINAGNYTGELGFQNTTNGNGDDVREMSLTIYPSSVIDATVTPGTGLSETIYQGEQPTGQKTYTITNYGTQHLDWRVSSTEAWVDLDVTGGALDYREDSAVVVSYATSSYDESGNWSAGVKFVDDINGTYITTRNVSLDVSATPEPPPPPTDEEWAMIVEPVDPTAIYGVNGAGTVYYDLSNMSVTPSEVHTNIACGNTPQENIWAVILSAVSGSYLSKRILLKDGYYMFLDLDATKFNTAPGSWSVANRHITNGVSGLRFKSENPLGARIQSKNLIPLHDLQTIGATGDTVEYYVVANNANITKQFNHWEFDGLTIEGAGHYLMQLGYGPGNTSSNGDVVGWHFYYCDLDSGGNGTSGNTTGGWFGGFTGMRLYRVLDSRFIGCSAHGVDLAREHEFYISNYHGHNYISGCYIRDAGRTAIQLATKPDYSQELVRVGPQGTYYIIDNYITHVGLGSGGCPVTHVCGDTMYLSGNDFYISGGAVSRGYDGATANVYPQGAILSWETPDWETLYNEEGYPGWYTNPRACHGLFAIENNVSCLNAGDKAFRTLGTHTVFSKDNNYYTYPRAPIHCWYNLGNGVVSAVYVDSAFDGHISSLSGAVGTRCAFSQSTRQHTGTGAPLGSWMIGRNGSNYPQDFYHPFTDAELGQAFTYGYAVSCGQLAGRAQTFLVPNVWGTGFMSESGMTADDIVNNWRNLQGEGFRPCPPQGTFASGITCSGGWHFAEAVFPFN